MVTTGHTDMGRLFMMVIYSFVKWFFCKMSKASDLVSMQHPPSRLLFSLLCVFASKALHSTQSSQSLPFAFNETSLSRSCKGLLEEILGSRIVLLHLHFVRISLDFLDKPMSLTSASIPILCNPTARARWHTASAASSGVSLNDPPSASARACWESCKERSDHERETLSDLGVGG